MRLLEVPARVVTGYQGGEQNPVDGFMTVRQSDAHAWTEVWLQGQGWVRIDPTSVVAPVRIQSGAGEVARQAGRGSTATGTDVPWLRALRYNWEAVENSWNQWVLTYSLERQQALVERLASPPGWKASSCCLRSSWASCLPGSRSSRCDRDWCAIRWSVLPVAARAARTCRRGGLRLVRTPRALCPDQARAGRRRREAGAPSARPLRAAALRPGLGQCNARRCPRPAPCDPGLPAPPQSAVTHGRRSFLVALAALAVARPAQARSPYVGRPEVQQFVEELAATHGFDRARLERWLRDARYSASVERLMQPPIPFGQRNWLEYRQRYLDPARVQAGVDFWQTHRAALARAEEEYGVPAEIIVAVIGVETYFGRITGNFRTLDVFTTLTFDYLRRADFYRAEFIEFLLLAREQRRDPLSYRGSFAGAIGLPQFMPGSIRRWGVDFDGDSRIDLLASPTDAIGSVANFLVGHGCNATCRSSSRPRPTKASSMPSVAASRRGRHGPRHCRQASAPRHCCRSIPP